MVKTVDDLADAQLNLTKVTKVTKVTSDERYTLL